MINKILLLILITFTLSACENNFYQVSELREVTEKLSTGELPPDFKYPKNTVYIDSLKIRISPCKENGETKCSRELADELLMAATTYFNSTLAYTENIFSAETPGNAKLESNYMSLYNSAKALAAYNDTNLTLTDEQAEALEKAYADWQKKQ